MSSNQMREELEEIYNVKGTAAVMWEKTLTITGELTMGFKKESYVDYLNAPENKGKYQSVMLTYNENSNKHLMCMVATLKCYFLLM